MLSAEEQAHADKQEEAMVLMEEAVEGVPPEVQYVACTRLMAKLLAAQSAKNGASFEVATMVAQKTFYTLLGDVALRMNRKSDALIFLSKALSGLDIHGD